MTNTNDKTTLNEVKQDTGTAVDTAMNYSKDKAGELKDSLEVELARLDVELEALRQHKRELSAQARDKWNRKLERVAESRKQVESKLRALKTASADALSELQQGVFNALNELKTAYNDAAMELDNSRTEG